MIGLAVYTYSWLVRFIGRRLDLTGCMHGPVEVCTDRSTDRANLLKLIGWRQEEELFWFQRSKATRPPFIFPNIHCKFVTSTIQLSLRITFSLTTHASIPIFFNFSPHALFHHYAIAQFDKLNTTLGHCTTGDACTRGKNTRGSLPRVQHSGKSLRGCLSRGRGLPRVTKIVHSGKASPSAVLALGEDLTPSVPFVFLENLFPECNTQGRNLFFI
jgi:hypothetical protein